LKMIRSPLERTLKDKEISIILGCFLGLYIRGID